MDKLYIIIPAYNEPTLILSYKYAIKNKADQVRNDEAHSGAKDSGQYEVYANVSRELRRVK